MPMKGHPLRQRPKRAPPPQVTYTYVDPPVSMVDGALRLYAGISTKQGPEETGDRTLVGGEGIDNGMVVEGGPGRPYLPAGDLSEISLL